MYLSGQWAPRIWCPVSAAGISPPWRSIVIWPVSKSRCGTSRPDASACKKMATEERRRASAGLKVIREIYRATGARRVIESPVQIGLHLMGGCALGTQRAQSVVNPEFVVHGMPRLHVMDGSLFPDAPGIN